MQASDAREPDNKYVIDIEEAAETARLMEQDKLFTQAMGGLFPEQPDLSTVEQLLDIGCGPGGWTLEVAHQYQDIDVIGIDINPTMVNYAFAQARTQELQNVSFEVMNARQPLEFQDNSFGLVNARFITGFMDQVSWPVLLAECKRVVRPGGIVRLTEAEFGTSSSPALQTLGGYLIKALAQQKRTFSVDERSIGLAHVLGRLLRDAGFEQINRRPFCLVADYGTDQYYNSYKESEVTFALLKPYLTRAGFVDEETYNKLYQQMLLEMLQEDFTSISFGLTIWAKKPMQA